jgi:hypothetical protein
VVNVSSNCCNAAEGCRLKMLDTKVMAQIAETHFSPVVTKQFGAEGSRALRQILEFLRTRLFRDLDIDLFREKIIVFKAFGATNPLPLKGSTVLTDTRYLTQEAKTGLIIQLLDRSRIRVWKHSSAKIESLSKKAVVYVYHERSDRFVANGKIGVIPNPDPQHASVFAIPTFNSLADALIFYKAKRARNSACKILQGAWFEDARLFFKTKPKKPEAVMRDSLSEFLKDHLRGDVDVHPEHNVNESEPVDIRVQWLFSKSLALIEIKWMGKSKSPAGKITASHGPSRARQGAKRLAEYLEEEKMQTPSNALCGYLVVIDARRWGVKPKDTRIDSHRGLHYENLEIPFSPKYHQTRNDFEEPVRMFVAPRFDT